MQSENKSLSLGVILVILGAASYGSLSSLVKLAYQGGISTSDLLLAQYLLGVLLLILLRIFMKSPVEEIKRGDTTRLILAGLCLGLTSIFYYLSVHYILASIAVVLLMQSVWIGVIIEAIRDRKFPSLKKIIAVVIVLIGTVFATDVIQVDSTGLDYRGLIFGFLAALSFSMVLLSTNTVATYLSPTKRSLFMLYGGSSLVLIYTFLIQIGPYYFNIELLPAAFIDYQALNFPVFYTWGIPLAIFGAVLPPILFNRGFPLTGVGLGSILSATELPVSIFVAYLLLGEVIISSQWIGVILIILAIVILNLDLQQLNRKLKALFLN